MKAIFWDEASQGMKFDMRDIPANSSMSAKEWREKMVEAAAEASEELMNKYLEDGDLREDVKAGLASAHHRQRDRADAVRLRLQEQGCAGHAGCGHRLPAGADRYSAGQGHPGKRRARKASAKADDEKFAGLAFKIMTDPYVGQLTFFRVYSGVLKSGDTIYNPIKGRKERIGRMVCRCTPTSVEEIKEVRAGDIAAAVGLKEATTGETLCDPDKVITLERMEFPEPVIHVAVEPKTKADQEKMGHRAEPSGSGRSVVPRAYRRGVRPDHHLRHGRTAPGNHR
jgi:elongation factor G